MKSFLLSVAAATLLLTGATASWAAIAVPLVTDLNFAAGDTQLGEAAHFGGANLDINDTAVFENNNISVYTLISSGDNGGAGFSLGISNGENGSDSSAGGENVDIENTTPVNQAIFDANFDPVDNPEGRLQNGNVIRVSAWFQQDPNNPISLEPSVEPILKVELWKEAESDFFDFTTGRAATSAFGDRVWDTDVNAPDPFYAGFNQSQASRIDLNNDGDIASGDDLTLSLPPTEGADWQLLVTELLIDDTPDNSPGFHWEVGDEQFTVDSVEEIRAVFFVGDFAGNDLGGGGSFFVDNLLLEVFADQAAADAVPVETVNPVPVQDFVPGDYNEDGTVDVADYTVWRDNLGADEGTLPNDVDGGQIGIAQYNTWVANFGGTLPASLAAVAVVPEPASAASVLAALGGLLMMRRRRGC